MQEMATIRNFLDQALRAGRGRSALNRVAGWEAAEAQERQADG